MASSPRALQEWCRVTCTGYPGVAITNMSSSFRDGLAFCAIIHKHRADLIDFASLSKDDAYQNNKLAFEVAETKLGIPALLDPKDMVSTKVPDRLSVISYLSQYYYFFSRKTSAAGPVSSRSSHSTVLHGLTKSKTPHGLKHMKSLTDLETSQDGSFSDTKPHKVCSLCLKPVHLIQRHLIDGKVYHRSCFRCKVCNITLLPQSYVQASDSGSLICTYHSTVGKSTRINLSQQTGAKCKLEAVYYSLGGLAITSIPLYTKKTETQDKLVCKAGEAGRTERREVRDRENRDLSVAPPHLATSKDSQVQQSMRNTSELPSSCVQVTEGRTCPAPVLRQVSESSAVPVPAPRVKTMNNRNKTMNSSPSAGSLSSQSKSPPSPSNVTSSKVKSNHPWMAIVHPGPWTQLPPAPAPIPSVRSKSVSNFQGSCNRPKAPPRNPFEEEEDEDSQREDAKPESEGHTELLVAAVHSQTSSFESEENKDKKPIPQKRPDIKEDGGAAECGAVKGMTAEAPSGEPAGETEVVTKQSLILPRSLSVPAIASDNSHSPSVPAGLTKADEAATSYQSKTACKENPFDRKPVLPQSKTSQDFSSSRGPAPGHGFPLIKRKVQADQCASIEDLQVQMRELDKQLESLEQRGVELERNLRGCKNDKEEEQMIMEWFSLIHERHVLLCQDTELVYLTKQQKLEDRQAEVEYGLRCLFNKPESSWIQEDRDQEKKLLDELVSIIEQRNQIISSLDQDRQRESEKDVLWEDTMKHKDFQKESLKDLTKSKRKFKPTKVLKMLTHKAEDTKDSMEKKS